MKVVVDGSIYRYQLHGGITRIWNEILPRMCEQDEDLSFEVLTLPESRQALPSHERIGNRAMPNYEVTLRPRRVWRRVEWRGNYAPFPRAVRKKY